jgi:N6-L-threonylcarbamoyladenine synthase
VATILGIESTCDETSAAVVVDGRRVLSNVVSSQVELHARFRGVVPEIASRAHIENLLPVLRQAIDQSGVGLDAVDAIAVSHRPGLIGSLLVGVTAAKSLAWSLSKPLIGVDHVLAHLYSVCLEDASRASAASPRFPAVGLVCSGGHTALYRLGGFLDIELLGRTLDDAVGEAYDKVAALLGLGYPGGPIIDGLAAEGEARAVHFPRTMLGRQSLDFSFSGLKTAVLYHVKGYQGRQRDVSHLSPQDLRDVAASFQAAVMDVLMGKLRRAIKATGAASVIVGGGVSANRALREALGKLSVPALLPPAAYCTDNAAMVAGLADLMYGQGLLSNLELDAVTHSEFATSAVSTGAAHGKR